MSFAQPQAIAGKKKVYFENLDGLRFFCFLAVFFFHCFHTGHEALQPTASYAFLKNDVFGNGNLGVNCFFVLSGFLITFLLIEEKKLRGQLELRHFWMRRILRIWPLYFFSVAFGFFIFPLIKTSFGQQPNETASLLHYLTFTSNFEMIREGLPDALNLSVLWSVAIEEQFYLVWPVLLFVLPVCRYPWVFGAVIAASLVFRGANDEVFVHEYHTLSCIGDMAVGAWGAWLVHRQPRWTHWLAKRSRWQIALLYATVVFVLLARDEVLFRWQAVRVIERLLIAVVFMMVILEQCYCRNSLFKCGRLGVSKLGAITYGLYCLHFIAILFVTTLTQKLGWNRSLWQMLLFDVGGSLLVSIILARLSYRFLEKPFLNLKERFAFVSRK